MPLSMEEAIKYMQDARLRLHREVLVYSEHTAFDMLLEFAEKNVGIEAKLSDVREQLEGEYHLLYSQYTDPDGDMADVLASAKDTFEMLIAKLGGDPDEVVSDLHEEDEDDE